MTGMLGCIADDFTGASDAASFLKQAGFHPVLLNGVPGKGTDLPEDCNAAVVALKTRTMETSRAVDQTLSAARWLKSKGADRFYLKYCSTFDSVPEGNIGPEADALMEFCGVTFTVLCPSLPVNGRQVKNGHLYVNGTPLHESSMKHHPLTPMWDSYIPELMKGQSRYPCHVLTAGEMKDSGALAGRIRRWEAESSRFYLVPDYWSDEDGARIGRLFGDMKLLTGGSGLLGQLRPGRNGGSAGAPGRTLLLSGSCSSMTLRQLEYYRAAGGNMREVSPFDLMEGRRTAEDYIAQLEENQGGSILFYSSAPPEEVLRAQSAGKQAVADRLEAVMWTLAARAVELGYTRIITAGGETSGAVISHLGFEAFSIGPAVAPGVPILIPLKQPRMRLVLKSGNFGAEDFFCKAEKMCGGDIQSTEERRRSQ